VTLIVSVLASDWVMQASDRRFTGRIDGERLEFRDGANKAVFAAERFAFAFTGRVDVDGQCADEWLQLALSRLFARGMSAEEAFEEVGHLLTGKFMVLASDDDNRALSVIGVGWSDESFAARAPSIIRISNMHDRSGRRLHSVGDEFSVSTDSLEGKPFLVSIDGVGLHPEQRGALEAQIDCLLSQGEEAEPVARLVVEAMRQQADDSDSVGRGVMLNNLPRAPGPPDGMITLIGRWPEKSVRTFAYFPEDDDAAVMHAPLVVSSDGSMMGNFQASGADVTLPSFAAPMGATSPTSGLMYSDPANPPSTGTAVGQAVRAVPKLGRNDPCWCESGKKFKKCHGA
jgi:SEC-C motif